MSWARVLLLLAACVAGAAGARLEVTRQPVGNERKGFPLAQQPRVQVVLDSVDELVPAGAGTLNTAGGSIQAPMHPDSANARASIDVTNFNMVTVSFGSNPVGTTFAGGATELRVKLVQGVADFIDIQVMQGGAGFTLVFSVKDSHGDTLTVESDAFNCGGQEARMVIRQQPILTVDGAVMRLTPAIIDVVDPYAQRLKLANPVVTVSLFANPGNAQLSASSRVEVRGSNGVVMVDEAFLTRAATEFEPEVPAHLQDRLSTKYRVRFSSPGFPDLISADFETLPRLLIDQQPVSDHTRTVTEMCSGNLTGCQVQMSNYLRPMSDGSLENLQTAFLHIDIVCTDLDGPDEFVTGVKVGGRNLKPMAEYAPGPFDGCGFAGCRDQCESNMRRIVSALDVKDDIGSYDAITNLYKSMGGPLPVHVAISDKVNICPCNGQPLTIKAQLVVTYSQAPEQQGSPLRQQPRVILMNGDASIYALRQKFVSVTFATDRNDPFDAESAFGNPSGALLTGNTRMLSEDGVVQFTDLAITEGGKGFVLRFSIRGIYNVNSTTWVDSQPLNVGSGSFPKLTLDCVDCSRPAPSRQEARSLSQPPQLELQRRTPQGAMVKSASYIKVQMSLGLNGPKGMFSGDTITVRNANGGAVKFSDATIYNGNCAFCPASTCGDGYSLYFIANDVAIESQRFDIAGGNRSPRFIAPTPAAGATFTGIFAVPRVLFRLNVTDDNHNDIQLSLTSPQRTSVTCRPAATCLSELNGALEWGAKVVFIPQAQDDECGRPLFAGNGPLRPSDGLYWGVYSDITFSATCDLTAPTYPPPAGGAPAVEDVCFRPSDKVSTVDPPITTMGEQRCFHVKIMTPAAPFFTLPYRFDHMQAGIQHIATPSAEEAVEIQARIELLQYPAAPLPTYIPPHAGGASVKPAAAGEDIKSLHVGVGCRIVLPIAAAEVQANVMGNNTLETLLSVRAFRTTRSSLYEQVQLPSALPQGARIHEGKKANPHVSSFEWEPFRGQEGYVYSVCFEIVAEMKAGCTHRFYTAPYHGHASQYCVDVHVERCQYCLRAGDSLEEVARDWGTSMLQLWSGNPALMQPSLLDVGMLLHLGIAYTADVDDRLPALAQQMGRSVEELLAWNPDLPRHAAALLRGDEVLLSSASSYAHREAPWAVRNGTFVADSQSVCMLPNICTFGPLPTGKTAEDTGSVAFSCDLCAEGTEFCTGALCVAGEGVGPWTRETCSTYRGSRCERCVRCREEQFDASGHVTVAGTWRSGGCDGVASDEGILSSLAEEKSNVVCQDCTSDSTCTPCTVCSDGEVLVLSRMEVEACTPMSDRKCVPVGPTVGADGTIVAPPKYPGWHDTFLPAPK